MAKLWATVGEGRRKIWPHTKVAYRECRKCGKWYTVEAKHAKHRFFCEPCGKDEERRHKRQREMLERSVPSEPYTLGEIAERDGYRCGICRKRVLMSRKAPHPKSPSIDHILPISAGGHDTRANVQLAHFWCNSQLRAAGTKQLLLVG